MNNIKYKWFLRTETLPAEIPTLFSNAPLYKNIFTFIKSIDSLSDLDDSLGQLYTIPLYYYIPKNSTDKRKLALLHPVAQLTLLVYTIKYDFLITKFCEKSSFSLRSPFKLNKVT